VRQSNFRVRDNEEAEGGRAPSELRWKTLTPESSEGSGKKSLRGRMRCEILFIESGELCALRRHVWLCLSSDRKPRFACGSLAFIHTFGRRRTARGSIIHMIQRRSRAAAATRWCVMRTPAATGDGAVES
jgi:hypothetical protein